LVSQSDPAGVFPHRQSKALGARDLLEGDHAPGRSSAAPPLGLAPSFCPVP
jgi:hypothetical protein